MNKKQLIEEVANKTGLSKKDAGAAVDATFEAIAEHIKDKVTIPNFGSFSVKEVKEQKRKNTFTGEEYVQAAYNKIRFKPFTSFKNAVK